MKDSILYSFHIPGMACGGCLAAVTKAIQKLDSNAQVEADLGNRNISVRSERSEASLLTALENAGYPAQPAVADR